MDYVSEIEPNVWRVELAGVTRVIRYREDPRSFAPWGIFTGEGRRLWGSPSLASAFRWIQARTGLPMEAALVEGLLGRMLQHNRDASKRLTSPCESAAMQQRRSLRSAAGDIESRDSTNTRGYGSDAPLVLTDTGAMA
jgi:hypothetical protein